MRVGGPSSAAVFAAQYGPKSTPTPDEAQFEASKNTRQGERDLLVREGYDRSYDVRQTTSVATDQVRTASISYDAQAKVTNDMSAQRRNSFGAASESYTKGAIIDVYV